MQTNLTAGMSDFDTRRFKLRPWYGDQGEYFVRVFVPDMEGYFHHQVCPNIDQHTQTAKIHAQRFQECHFVRNERTRSTSSRKTYEGYEIRTFPYNSRFCPIDL